MVSRNQALLIAAGAGLGLVVALTAKAGGIGGAGQAVGGAVVDFADGVLTGGVQGVGDVLGVPRTDEQRGWDAVARGDWWEASFLLPAGDFLGAAWDSVF